PRRRRPRRDDDEAPLPRGAELQGGAGGDPAGPRHGLLLAVRGRARERGRRTPDRQRDAGSGSGVSAVSYGERIRRVPPPGLPATARGYFYATVVAAVVAAAATSAASY